MPFVCKYKNYCDKIKEFVAIRMELLSGKDKRSEKKI